MKIWGTKNLIKNNFSEDVFWMYTMILYITYDYNNENFWMVHEREHLGHWVQSSLSWTQFVSILREAPWTQLVSAFLKVQFQIKNKQSQRKNVRGVLWNLCAQREKMDKFLEALFGRVISCRHKSNGYRRAQKFTLIKLIYGARQM